MQDSSVSHQPGVAPSQNVLQRLHIACWFFDFASQELIWSIAPAIGPAPSAPLEQRLLVFRHALSEASRPVFFGHLKEAIETGVSGPVQLQIEYQGRAGLYESIASVRYDGARRAGVEGYFRDCTAEVAKDATLATLGSLLQNLLDNSVRGTLAIDRSGIMRNVNARFLRLTGLAPDLDLRNRPFTLLATRPGLSDLAAAIKQRLQRPYLLKTEPNFKIMLPSGQQTVVDTFGWNDAAGLHAGLVVCVLPPRLAAMADNPLSQEQVIPPI
jgi:PAS domain S-box-containing protein